MSYFGEFLSYVELYDSGRLWKDLTYKNYDLMWKATTAKLRTALADCGFVADELSVALAECAARVRERGFHLGSTVIRDLLCEWYVWRRISSGEYKKWKYRRSSATSATVVSASNTYPA